MKPCLFSGGVDGLHEIKTKKPVRRHFNTKRHFMVELTLLIIVVSSIWVYFDAKTIGLKKGQLTGICDMRPEGWFFACLGLWIVAFPIYLANRPEILRINGKSSAPVAPPVAPPALVPDFDEQLRKLAKLKQDGLLSEEEFSLKKKELLGI